jgi:hypothetical protein
MFDDAERVKVNHYKAMNEKKGKGHGFGKPVAEVSEKFLTAEQVKKSLDREASVFMMFASLKESSEKGVGDLPVVQEFPEVFPDDIMELPPERELEFAIDLVPRTSPISIAPYRMSV